jgi:gamma-glutamylcyclotransferase (GGCT)/AIG2-like uncharacterized protein YtfP
MNPTAETEQLFSYGTLQDEAVQLATFGRRLSGEPDSLPGYRLTRLPIQNPNLVAGEGEKYHLNVEFTGRDSNDVTGTVFRVTTQELERADIYELAADYKRISVHLKSGTQAWVYAGTPSLELR